MHIIPKPKTVYLPTPKSPEEIAVCLNRLYKNKRGVKFTIGHGDFVIEYVIWNRSSSTIFANGHVEPTPQKMIRLEVFARDSYLKYFGIFWYALLVIFLIFVVAVSITDRTFNLASFVIIPIAFFGYGMTTLRLKDAMEQLIHELRQAVK